MDKISKVEINGDGSAVVRTRRGSATWDVERVAEAAALSALCVEAGKWDCDCACCVVTTAAATSV